MARKKAEIKNQITANFMADNRIADAYGFTPGTSFSATFSLVSLENFLFETLAFALFVHEQLFANHRRDIDQALFNQKSGRLPWYRFMALQFQYGFNLLTDSDQFDNGGATDQEIENSKVIKYSAVNEAEDASRVIVKIAGQEGDQLAPITLQQREAFAHYMQEIKWAGVELTIINYLPDRLFLNLEIYRDPLVLDENGLSIQNGNSPVEDAIKEYMKELPFNGEFIVADFVDKLQQVEGVEIPHVLSVNSSWVDEAGGYGDSVPIYVRQVPVSGYYEVATFDDISYVV